MVCSEWIPAYNPNEIWWCFHLNPSYEIRNNEKFKVNIAKTSTIPMSRCITVIVYNKWKLFIYLQTDSDNWYKPHSTDWLTTDTQHHLVNQTTVRLKIGWLDELERMQNHLPVGPDMKIVASTATTLEEPEWWNWGTIYTKSTHTMAQNTAFALNPLKCDWGNFTKVIEEANLIVIEAASQIVNEAASLPVSEACSWGPISRYSCWRNPRALFSSLYPRVV